jgi:hypothetical protein
MPEYSIEEQYAVMHFMQNVPKMPMLLSKGRYTERFPQRRVRDRKIIFGVAQRLRTTGSVLPKN